MTGTTWEVARNTEILTKKHKNTITITNKIPSYFSYVQPGFRLNTHFYKSCYLKKLKTISQTLFIIVEILLIIPLCLVRDLKLITCTKLTVVAQSLGI